MAIPHYNMRWSSGSPFGVVNVTENLAGLDCFANVLHLDSQWSISPKFFLPIPFFDDSPKFYATNVLCYTVY